MIDFLRDPLWQFIGVILAFLTILISIVLFRFQKTRKKMSYKIVSSIPVLSVEEELSGKLKILYENSPVKNVYLVVIKILNSGNIPVVSTDYERPLSIDFGEGTEVLTSSISGVSPDNLKVFAESELSGITIKPVLLNPTDFFVIKTLVSHFEKSVVVDARIVGVNKIDKVIERGIFSTLNFVGLLITTVGMVLYSIALPKPENDVKVNGNWPYLLLIGTGYLLMFSNILRELLVLRRLKFSFFKKGG